MTETQRKAREAANTAFETWVKDGPRLGELPERIADAVVAAIDEGPLTEQEVVEGTIWLLARQIGAKESDPLITQRFLDARTALVESLTVRLSSPSR